MVMRSCTPRALVFAWAWLGLLLLLATAQPALARSVKDVPSPRRSGGWVVDEPGVLKADKKKINAAITELEHQTSMEIAVVILSTIDDEVPRDFATALFNHWGIGKKGKDNGILILQVVDQRRVEIEVGYGLEELWTDARCKRLLDRVTLPLLKEGKPGRAHLATVQTLSDGLLRPEVAARFTPPEPRWLSSLRPILGWGTPMSLLLFGLWWLLGRAQERGQDRLHILYLREHYPILPGVLLQVAPVALLPAWLLSLIWPSLLESLLTWLFLVGAAFWAGAWAHEEWLGFQWKPWWGRRHCPVCKETMKAYERRAFEDKPGPWMMSVGSSSRSDLWFCSCGVEMVEMRTPLESDQAPKESCPCQAPLWMRVHGVLLQEPTREESGQQRRVYTCVRCLGTVEQVETLPVLPPPPRPIQYSGRSYSSAPSARPSVTQSQKPSQPSYDNSDYDWGSSSGGDDWGGGSSGGGGAGGDY